MKALAVAVLIAASMVAVFSMSGNGLENRINAQITLVVQG